MDLRVTESHSWADIETAAHAANTCIRAEGVNNRLARESWEAGEGKVRYFLQEARSSSYQWYSIGYVRLHRVSENANTTLPKLWAVDFAAPFSYRAIRLVWQQIREPVITHKRTSEDPDLAEGWLTLPLKLSLIENYQFRQCHGQYESGWLVVA
jgi:hypothetical protein